MPTVALSGQHAGWAWQVFERPTPIAVIGSQFRPTATSTPWRTTPIKPRRRFVLGSLDCGSGPEEVVSISEPRAIWQRSRTHARDGLTAVESPSVAGAGGGARVGRAERVGYARDGRGGRKDWEREHGGDGDDGAGEHLGRLRVC